MWTPLEIWDKLHMFYSYHTQGTVYTCTFLHSQHILSVMWRFRTHVVHTCLTCALLLNSFTFTFSLYSAMQTFHLSHELPKSQVDHVCRVSDQPNMCLMCNGPTAGLAWIRHAVHVIQYSIFNIKYTTYNIQCTTYNIQLYKRSSELWLAIVQGGFF